MIFYFTGTGNSLHAAEKIGGAVEEMPVSIATALDKGYLEYELRDGEPLGFVYPIYAWGPPEIVLTFIHKMKLRGGKPYVFSLDTCGAEDGHTAEILRKALRAKGLMLDAAFSVAMPGNYIIGEDVAPEEKNREILKKAEERLDAISEVIAARKSGVFELLPGEKPGLKSYFINPMFNWFGRDTKAFYATDACTKCGLCEKICPIHTITVREKPVWGKKCTQCLACINRCPAKAIQRGKVTESRGRYVYPGTK